MLFFARNPELPYMCKDCEVFVNTHFGKNLRKFYNELKKQVTQVETDIVTQGVIYSIKILQEDENIWPSEDSMLKMNFCGISI